MASTIQDYVTVCSKYTILVPYDEECAKIASEAAINGDFRQKARDYVVGSISVKIGCSVVISNKRDFEWAGEVYSPDEFLRG